jgi:hypothetical protein
MTSDDEARRFERQVSQDIGRIQSSLVTLFKRADEDRVTQRHHHEANQLSMGEFRQSTQKAISELKDTASKRYEGIERALDGLTSELRDHAAAVSRIQAAEAKKLEIRDARAAASDVSAQMSRNRLVALAGLGLLTLWIVGRLLEAGMTWMVGHFLGMKFGG